MKMLQVSAVLRAARARPLFARQPLLVSSRFITHEPGFTQTREDPKDVQGMDKQQAKEQEGREAADRRRMQRMQDPDDVTHPSTMQGRSEPPMQEGLAEKLAQTMGDFPGRMADAAGTAASRASDRLSETVESAREHLPNMEMGTVRDTMRDQVKGAAERGHEAMAGVADKLRFSMEGVTEGAKDRAPTQGVEERMKAPGSLGDEMSARAEHEERAGRPTAESLRRMAQEMSEKGADVTGLARDMAARTAEKGKDATENMRESAEGYVETAKGLGAAAMGKTMETGHHMADRAKEMGYTAAEKGKDAATGMRETAEGMAGKTMETGQHMSDRAKEMGQTATDKARDVAHDAKEKVMHTGEAMVDKAKDIGGSVAGGAHKVVEMGKEGVNSVEEGAMHAAETIKNVGKITVETAMEMGKKLTGVGVAGVDVTGEPVPEVDAAIHAAYGDFQSNMRDRTEERELTREEWLPDEISRMAWEHPGGFDEELNPAILIEEARAAAQGKPPVYATGMGLEEREENTARMEGEGLKRAMDKTKEMGMKAKGKVEEAGHKVTDKVGDVAGKAKDKVKDMAGKSKK